MSEIKTERILSNPSLTIDHAGSGDMLILMHGIGGNRTNWTEQIEAFAPHFHTLAWDARGYGDSDDYEGELDFSDFSRDLVKVLDHFGVEKAHIGGLSMGGRIAQDFNALFPERVKSLILVSTFSGFNNFTDAEKQHFIDIRRRPLVEEGKEPKDIAPVVAKTLIGPDATEEQFQRLVDSMAALHKDSYIKTVTATTRYDRTAELENIAVPTLLLFGEKDGLTRPDMGEQMASRVKDCDFIVIPRAGHLVNLEQPDLFNETVLQFLLKRKI